MAHAAARSHSQERPEEESYFVSMTDLMVGLLFIFIIMLMAFALNLRTSETEARATTETLLAANETRARMLREIEQALRKEGVEVWIDEENGVLRLPEELLFDRREFQLQPKGRERVQRLAHVLSRMLPCYAHDPDGVPTSVCPPSKGGRLHAVLIEGHTDDVPIVKPLTSGIRSNWELSAARAIQVYNELTQAAPILARLENDAYLVDGHGEKLFGVSGYAEYRPVDPSETEDARAHNRRIDLRFLMATPRTGELEKIREKLNESAPR